MDYADQLSREDLLAMTAGSASRVDSHLYVGGYLAAADPAFIKKAGIQSIVKLFADTDEYPGGYHRHPGVDYLVVPVDDTPECDIRPAAYAAVRFIREAVRANKHVLVHCHMGISRSATVVLFYMMLDSGYGLDMALARLRLSRPFVQPNPGFMRHLRATDARVRRLRVGDEHRRVSASEASRPYVAPPPVLAFEAWRAWQARDARPAARRAPP